MLLRERVVTGNTEVVWSEPLEPAALDVARQELEIMAWSRPGSHVKILEFFSSLQETYFEGDLVEVRLLEESESGSGSAGLGGAVTNELTVRLVNRGGRFDVTNPDSPLRELLRPNRRVRAWLGIEGAKHLWGEGWYAPFDRDLTLSRQNGTVIEPLPGYVATLRPGEGRFGGAVAVEEGTTNGIQNGNFATGDFTGWTDWDPENGQKSIVIRDGIKYAKIELISAGQASFGIQSTKNISVQPGDKVTVSFRLRGEKPNYAHLMLTAGSNINISSFIQYTDLPNGESIGEYTWTSDRAADVGFLFGYRGTPKSGEFTHAQLEKKPYRTPFVDGTRPAGRLSYDIPQLKGARDFTLHFKFLPYMFKVSIHAPT